MLMIKDFEGNGQAAQARLPDIIGAAAYAEMVVMLPHSILLTLTLIELMEVRTFLMLQSIFEGGYYESPAIAWLPDESN